MGDTPERRSQQPVSQEYLLARGGSSELERLRLQARVWEPEVEAMLDRIGLASGVHCIDLGCGPVGILGPLSRRAGPEGRVVGVELDPTQLTGAREHVQDAGLRNVQILERDAYDTRLPRASFDFVHARFVFAPAGRDEALLREMFALTRPGGTLAIQEPDASTWGYFPPRPAWDKLKAAILAAFARGGGDFNAGQRMYGLMRRAGAEQVQVRAAIIALQDAHPYMRAPVQLATSLRRRIVDAGFMSEPELEEAMAGCEEIAKDPDTFALSFTVTQIWGRKPSGKGP